MKAKFFAAAFALVASAGLFAASYSATAQTSSRCRGEQYYCGRMQDGTPLYKGGGVY